VEITISGNVYKKNKTNICKDAITLPYICLTTFTLIIKMENIEEMKICRNCSIYLN